MKKLWLLLPLTMLWVVFGVADYYIFYIDSIRGWYVIPLIVTLVLALVASYNIGVSKRGIWDE